MFNEKDLALKKINGRSCLYKCNEPKGSLVWGVFILSFVQVIVPTFVDFFTGAIPLTLEGMLDEMFVNFSIVINYMYSPSPMDLVFFFVGSFIAGIIALRQGRALISCIAFLGVSILAFFFFAFFVIGASVDYGLFFASMFSLWGLVKFAGFTVLPIMLGALTAKVLYSKKTCYVVNSASVIRA